MEVTVAGVGKFTLYHAAVVLEMLIVVDVINVVGIYVTFTLYTEIETVAVAAGLPAFRRA
ncbi:hypothetical protein D3C80_921440 [compost metagenome]